MGAFELTAGPPSAPSFLAASAGDKQVSLSWVAPADNGSPITQYTVTPYIGVTAQPAVEVAAPATSTAVTGLTNRTTYSFFVTATNAIGTSPSSNQSAAVTPEPLASVTSLSISGGGPAYGHETAVTFTASVTPASPVPSGTVTIKSGTVVLCTITLPAARHCSLSAAKLGAGTHRVAAYYGGDSDFDPSVSGKDSLVIGKASSRAALTLSPTKVTYGDEQVEKFSVTVTPQFAGTTPTGKVAVMAGTLTLCVITLSDGKGSCWLSPAQSKVLAAGSHTIVGSYGGDSNFNGTKSKGEVLTVRG